MQLSLLGQSYEAFISTIEAIETNETATFLGTHYVRKQFNVSQHQQPTSELTYRGVGYSYMKGSVLEQNRSTFNCGLRIESLI